MQIRHKETGEIVLEVSGVSLAARDLRGARLHHAVLRRADLSGADFTRAELDEASLNFANLGGAKLRYASLVCAVLIQADLSEADLDRADFMHAALNGTDLLGANLAGALFRHAVLGGCRNLDRARGVAEARYLELGSLDVRTLRASLGALSEESIVALGIAKEAVGSLRSAVGLGRV